MSSLHVLPGDSSTTPVPLALGHREKMEAGIDLPEPARSAASRKDVARPAIETERLDEYEDLGRVTDALLHTLRLQPGQFTRT